MKWLVLLLAGCTAAPLPTPKTVNPCYMDLDFIDEGGTYFHVVNPCTDCSCRSLPFWENHRGPHVDLLIEEFLPGNRCDPVEILAVRGDNDSRWSFPGCNFDGTVHLDVDDDGNWILSVDITHQLSHMVGTFNNQRRF